MSITVSVLIAIHFIFLWEKNPLRVSDELLNTPLPTPQRARTHARTHAHTHTLKWSMDLFYKNLLSNLFPSVCHRLQLQNQQSYFKKTKKNELGFFETPRAHVEYCSQKEIK